MYTYGYVDTQYMLHLPKPGPLGIAWNFCSDLFVLSWNLTASSSFQLRGRSNLPLAGAKLNKQINVLVNALVNHEEKIVLS